MASAFLQSHHPNAFAESAQVHQPRRSNFPSLHVSTLAPTCGHARARTGSLRRIHGLGPSALSSARWHLLASRDVFVEHSGRFEGLPAPLRPLRSGTEERCRPDRRRRSFHSGCTSALRTAGPSLAAVVQAMCARLAIREALNTPQRLVGPLPSSTIEDDLRNPRRGEFFTGIAGP